MLPVGMLPSARRGTLGTRLYLVRHGRTMLNAAGALRGRLDVPLDEVGQGEAAALGRALGTPSPSVIVSSPMRRSVETARRIASLSGRPVRIDSCFVDRDYGPWAGHQRGAVEREWGSLHAAPGVEPWPAMLDRVRRGFEALTTTLGAGEVAVLVAHEVINQLLMASLDQGWFASPHDIPQRTGCFNVLERIRGRWRVTAVDVLPDSVDRDEREDRLHCWLGLCRQLAASNQHGIEEPAARLADLAGGDRQLMERARRVLFDDPGPADPLLVQSRHLWRRAFEKGTWSWDDESEHRSSLLS